MNKVKKTTAEKAKEVKNAEKTASKAVKAAVKKTQKTIAEQAETVVNAGAREATAGIENITKTLKNVEKKVAEKKATDSAKSKVVREAVYLQYLGKDIKVADLADKAKQIWTTELNKDEAELQSVSLYLKPEDNAAYYVLNDSFSGRIEL